MASERNALAELANSLVAIGIKCDDENAAVRISHAQRIIAELARLEVIKDSNLVRDPGEAVTAVEMARAIAEKGANHDQR